MGTSRICFPIDGVAYVTAADAATYLEAGAWLPMTAGDALRQTARTLPDKPALVAPDRRVTFGEWDEMSERLGAALLALGLTPGDRALFQMGTVVETAVALFGCFKAGVVPVCTLPQHREIEIGDLSARTGARAHFVQADVSRFDLVRKIGFRGVRSSGPRLDRDDFVKDLGPADRGAAP